MPNPVFFTLQQVASREAWQQVRANGCAYVAEDCAKVSFVKEGQGEALQVVLMERKPSITARFTQYRLQYLGAVYSPACALDNLLSMMDYDLSGLITVCEALRFVDHGFGVSVGEVFGVVVNRSQVASALICNPFDEFCSQEAVCSERVVRSGSHLA
ncbi:hypothetical protein RE428_48770 (plasmid) [Marinobacter nanhaiticus D15-8W]|uniref:Uncharacterized protein n=1 Tax=Marinobacter nanhaiticus D15-8W TaxID=626887 RepID=N6X006_9GAMM|nr:hypothetical protein [Marinobacter nanhaiticus]ENO17131.1 hypothetical protein J057_00659 [Marinobacter nanhaiticus D15-8W]BES73859.1 hypothetical protein RE428_48770 [Marinobacter nanhaiticus D15-8W]